MGIINKRNETSPPPDMAQVGFAAQTLHISEYRVFQEAYREWFGHDVSDRLLSAVFHRYLHDGIAPCWVRSYARHLLDERREMLRRQHETRCQVASCFSAGMFLLTLSFFLHAWSQ